MRARRIAAVLGAGCLAVMGIKAAHAAEPSHADSAKVGRDLFVREWVANDPRARGGDGLGPVYNAESCVACHSVGGVGGSGPNDKNARIVTAVIVSTRDEDPARVPKTELIKAHLGFKDASSVVLHNKGVRPGYANWKQDLVNGTHGPFRMTTTERNTPPLFGAGLIDAIPNKVIEERALRSAPDFPEINGRVSRLPDGQLGRFGWKGQTASLDDFVRTACAVELGLEVPGHPQSPDPEAFDTRAPGLDLSDAECSALTAFLATLPRPIVRAPFDLLQAQNVRFGAETFSKIGCAGCHAPTLGKVEGLYSDLLLHDMGEGLKDSAIYYGTPLPSSPPIFASADPARKPTTSQEWRTPPLWGVRDSGPYLHDGRAATLDVAIRAHGGEAKETTLRYQSLRGEQRMQLIAFLNSLAAPQSPKAPVAKVASRQTRR